MRVISGSARGLKLQTPEGINTRPTTDRIKESLFNIINFELIDINFLDLFSGSGAIGIEALSRGAKKAVFVDNNRESINVIEKNLKSARLYDKAAVINNDIEVAIERLKNDNLKFNIIYMDPPYNKELVNKTIEIIYNSKILKKNGFIIAEQSKEDAVPYVEGFEVFRIKEYGKTTKIIFMRYKEENLHE